jgi:ankyrin repeat protein
MFAAKNGDKSTLDLLLAQGADPNAANVAGATALMLAAGNARSDVVRALLAAGAKPITKD